MRIEHERFGEYELPEFKQGEIESLYRTLREVNAGLTGVSDAESGEHLSAFVTGLAGADLSDEQWRVTVSEFMSNLRLAAQRRGKLSSVERAGNVVRAACRLGWLPFDDVQDRSPAEVTWLAGEIDRLVGEACSLDPI